MWASSCARNTGEDAVLVGFTTTTARSPPPPTGAARPSASGSGQHFPAAGRHCSIRPPARRSCSPGATATRCGKALRDPARAGDRSDLPPETERTSHYFRARLADQFDAVLHFDETRAVEPLEYTSEWEAGEVPETFPFAV